jgi:methylated-DNA-protein-cysteine methyltransferase-like protein
MNSQNSFFARVYDAVRSIPPGKVATYGQIALIAGNPRAPRAVGWALHVNPDPGQIPCHRVVNRSGRLAPAFAFGGTDAQKRFLEMENVVFLPNGNVDLRLCLWDGK